MRKTFCGTLCNPEQSLWSPLCSGRPVYVFSVQINTNKLQTNPLSALKLLRDADSSRTLSNTRMNIDTHHSIESHVNLCSS